MAQTDPGSLASKEAGEQRRLGNFLNQHPSDSVLVNRCEGYADSTGERCQRDAIAPFPSQRMSRAWTYSMTVKENALCAVYLIQQSVTDRGVL